MSETASVDPALSGAAIPASEADINYWFALIDERAAALFLDLTHRTLQGLRQKGGGPRFFRLSSRCVKYRRIDLRDFVESRLRASTSDPGP